VPIASDGDLRILCETCLNCSRSWRPVPELREGFDEVAELYDRVRPKYPDALFEELTSRLPEMADVVEVGPGTGQATGSLLARHARITAIELGGHLAERLRLNFEGNDDLRVVVSSFEDAVLPSHSFDALVAATAYHWIRQPIRLEKPLELLRPGGWVAIIDTVQVAAPTDDGFFDRVQPVYERHGQSGTHSPPPLPERATSHFVAEFDESPLYGVPALYRYRWDQTYDTSSYADLIRSYSGTRAMQEAEREALISELSKIIEEEFGGKVTRPLVITLTLAQTVS
jgi:SAM-dependent methyltransferase